MAKETTKEAAKINNIYAKLARVQNALTAKKDNTNQFGKYSYRTAEGIMENLKPLLAKEGLTGYFFNEVIEDGIFKSQFMLIDTEGDGVITSQHWTPVDSDLRGMSRGQMGGATASYCRKYLLCGLFMIDGGDHDLDARDQKADIEAAIVNAANVDQLTAVYSSQRSYIDASPDLFEKLKKKAAALREQTTNKV